MPPSSMLRIGALLAALLTAPAAAQPAPPSGGEDPSAAGSAGVGTPAAEATRLGEVVVEGREDSLVGVADAASEGTTGATQLERRPLARPGELLETVPGLIATQHSGAGKANQFFLRGFNLDHGTDFATFVDGVPVNLPSQRPRAGLHRPELPTRSRSGWP